MKRIIACSIAALALAVPAFAQEKKEERRVVIVNGDRIVVDEGQGPLVLRGGGYLGISTSNLTPDLRKHFGGTEDSGVMVGKVHEDTPAARAGLRVGDLVTAIDGKAVDNSFGITRALSDKKKGDQVRVDFIRNGARQQVSATLDERHGPMAFTWSGDGAPGFALPDVEEFRKKFKELDLEKLPDVRAFRFNDCEGLQQRVQDLETKLKELEKKLK